MTEHFAVDFRDSQNRVKVASPQKLYKMQLHKIQKLLIDLVWNSLKQQQESYYAKKCS